MTLARMLIRLEADDKVFQQILSRSIRRIETFSEAATGIGRNLTLGVTLPLGLMAKGIFDTTLRLDGLRVGLNALTGSANETAIQLDRLKQVAKAPGIGFAEAIQGSQQLQAVGFSARDAERALKGFGNAVAASGGGREQLARVVFQFQQMSAAGKVLGQDLRPMLQQAPVLARALVDAFGTVNAAQIAKLTGNFKNFFDIFIPAVEKLPDVSNSARTAVENLSDAFDRAQAAIGDKLLPALVPLVERLTTLLEKMEGISPETARSAVAWAATAAVMGPLISIIARITSGLALLKIAFRTLSPWVAVGGLIAAGVVWLTKKWIEKKLAIDETTEAMNAYTLSLRNYNKEQLITAQALNAGQVGLIDQAISAHENKLRIMRKRGGAVHSNLELASYEHQFIDPLKKAREYLINVMVPGTQAAFEMINEAAGDSASSFGSDLEEGQTHLDAMKDKASRLIEALEVLPLISKEWNQAQSEAISMMSEMTTLAEAQKDAIGETAIGYRSIVANLKEALGLNTGADFGILAPTGRPGTKGATPQGAMETIMVNVLPFVERARESALALHEFLMATNAAYAAQWTTTDQIRKMGFEAAVAFESMKQQFANPGQTGAQALEMLKGSAIELAQNFTPLGLLAYFLSQLLEDLAPAIEAFLRPIAILAQAVMPLFLAVMEALWPILKYVAIVATYLGQAITTVSGWIYKAIGALVTGLGKFLDSIPLLGDFGLIKIGQNLTKIGDGALATADGLAKAREEIKNLEWDKALDDATKGLEKLSEATMGAVQGFKVAQIRHEASDPVGPYAPVPTDTDRTARPRPTTNIIQGASFSTTLNFPEGDSGAQTYRYFYDELGNRVRSRGHDDPAVIFWESLPEPN